MKVLQRGASLRFLCAIAILLVAACSSKPGAEIAERSITAHFKQRGYLVRDISIGNISRNPVADRVYMGPLTYVVEVPAIVLEPETVAGNATSPRGAAGLRFSGVTVKIYALSPPQQGWVVSEVSGIALPLPSD